MANAVSAVALRNTLKLVFRANLSTARIYTFERMVQRYGTAERIIAAAGRSSLRWNVRGAVAATGGATTLANGSNGE